MYHLKKPTKMCVVFDCSAKYKGESLNDLLLQGPDLTNQLIGVLCRFRQSAIAFMCDVESMFTNSTSLRPTKISCDSFGGKTEIQPIPQ